MSYTEIHRITKSGNTKCIAEFRNAHRGAMAVWTILEERYLPPHMVYGMGPYSRMISFDSNKQQEVWDLAKDPRLTDSERICMLSTFDNVMCFRKDFERLCRAFRDFKGITSLPEQADFIETIKDKRTVAICWNQTSVNADIPPPNISNKYWNLFGDL